MYERPCFPVPRLSVPSGDSEGTDMLCTQSRISIACFFQSFGSLCPCTMNASPFGGLSFASLDHPTSFISLRSTKPFRHYVPELPAPLLAYLDRPTHLLSLTLYAVLGMLSLVALTQELPMHSSTVGFLYVKLFSIQQPMSVSLGFCVVPQEPSPF